MYRKQQDEKICLLYRSTLEKAGCIGADEVSLKETAMCAKLVDFLIEKKRGRYRANWLSGALQTSFIRQIQRKAAGDARNI